MRREVRIVSHPDELDKTWDTLAKWFYQKKEFLGFLHRYNYCNQQYYQLYKDDHLVAGTIVYSFRTNIMTFSRPKLYLNMRVIGLPISIATLPIIGEEHEFESLLSEILAREKGLILGLNFVNRYLEKKVLNMRTLPTIVINRFFRNYDEYLSALRHPYRRRLLHFKEKFLEVNSQVTGCDAFNEVHYKLYLDVMERSKTKLETLSLELFRNLPEKFILTTHYTGENMLAWHICTCDNETLFFFMGGLNYKFRNQYQSYQNNLISILRFAYTNNFKRIDLGQTAEIAKMKIGGIEDERGMFLYHKNAYLLFIFRLIRKLLEYSTVRERFHVFNNHQ